MQLIENLKPYEVSEELNEFLKALSQFQAKVEMPNRNQQGYHNKYKFASLDSVMQVIQEPLGANGLSIFQVPFTSGKEHYLLTRINHESGQYVQSVLDLNSSGENPHALGSMITYMRRYSLMSILGLAPQEDDDGQEAMKSKTGSPAAGAPAGQSGNRRSSGSPAAGTPAASKETRPETGSRNACRLFSAIIKQMQTVSHFDAMQAVYEKNINRQDLSNEQKEEMVSVFRERVRTHFNKYRTYIPMSWQDKPYFRLAEQITFHRIEDQDYSLSMQQLEEETQQSPDFLEFKKHIEMEEASAVA